MRQSILIAMALAAVGLGACGVSQQGQMMVWNGMDGTRACRIPNPPDKQVAVQPTTVPPPSPEMIAGAGSVPKGAPGAATPADAKATMNVAEQMYRDEVAMYRLCEARANHWIDSRTYRCELERFAHGVDGEAAWRGCIASPARESDGRQ